LVAAHHVVVVVQDVDRLSVAGDEHERVGAVERGPQGTDVRVVRVSGNRSRRQVRHLAA